MAIDIKMPALSPTMEEGTLRRWLVRVGDRIEAGDAIAEIETDKATMEVESPESGVLTELLIQEGAQGVRVYTVIARLESADLGQTPSKAEKPVQPSAQPQVAAPPRSNTADLTTSPITGTAPKTITVREALRDAIIEEMERDPDVFIIGEEVAEYQGAYKVTQGVLQRFGSRRVIDTPITEHGFAGLAVGSAFAGLRPIVEFMTMNFAMQAIDHIVNSAAKTLYMSGGQVSCPIVFRGPNGAASRVAAQHSQDYAAWYSHIPGLRVVAPYSAEDAKGLLKTAIRDPNPVVFLEHELLYGKRFELPADAQELVPFGKLRVWREGRDVTLVTYAYGVVYALEAAERLAELGISAEVLDLRSLRPLDREGIVRSVEKTHRCLTIEEGFPQCGIGAELCALVMELAFDALDAPVLRVTGADVPMPYAANLEKLALPSVDTIVERARELCT